MHGALRIYVNGAAGDAGRTGIEQPAEGQHLCTRPEINSFHRKRVGPRDLGGCKSSRSGCLQVDGATARLTVQFNDQSVRRARSDKANMQCLAVVGRNGQGSVSAWVHRIRRCWVRQSRVDGVVQVVIMWRNKILHSSSLNQMRGVPVRYLSYGGDVSLTIQI